MLAVAVISLALIAAVLRLDAWPLSCYPMFSKPLPRWKGMAYRIALEDAEGKLHWWRPCFPKIVAVMGDRYRACLSLPDERRRRLLAAWIAGVQNCIAQDPAPIEGVRNACVVERSIVDGPGGEWTTLDDIVERLPVPGGARSTRDE